MPPREPSPCDRFAGPETDFGRNHHVLPMFAQELAEHDFRLARRVEVGGVKEIDSRVDRLDDHGSRILPIDFVDRRLRWIAAERHGAESQAGNDQTAIAEPSVLHRNTSLIENRLVLSLPAPPSVL